MNRLFLLIGFVLLLVSVFGYEAKAQSLKVVEPESKNLKVLVEGDQNLSKTVLIENLGTDALFDLNAFLRPDVNGVSVEFFDSVLNGGMQASIIVSIKANELEQDFTKTFLVVGFEGEPEQEIKIEIEKAEAKQNWLSVAKTTVAKNPFLFGAIQVFLLVLLIVCLAGTLQAFDSTNANLVACFFGGIGIIGCLILLI